MDVELAGRLVGAEGAEALAAAAAEPDPDSLAAAGRVRAAHDPALAAAALQQVSLRRRAAARFGEQADRWWWTRPGLEQATRPVVSAWRAERLRDQGVSAIADLGCGLGCDAVALARAGLSVLAVERDPATAVLARANLAPHGVEVHVGDAEEWGPRLLGDGRQVFCDPARRTGAGRSWRLADLSPGYDWVRDLLRRHGGMAKLGPGLPHAAIGADADVAWLSDRGDVVEACLEPGDGRRSAVLLPDADELVAGTTRSVGGVVGPVRRTIVEPDGAVIRSGAVDTLADRLGAHRLADGIAYLCADDPPVTRWGTRFTVGEVLPWRLPELRRWVAEHDIGTLEIKKRGVEVDPATLRRRMRPRGRRAATWIITPTPDGARVLVVDRQPPPS